MDGGVGGQERDKLREEREDEKNWISRRHAFRTARANFLANFWPGKRGSLAAACSKSFNANALSLLSPWSRQFEEPENGSGTDN